MFDFSYGFSQNTTIDIDTTKSHIGGNEGPYSHHNIKYKSGIISHNKPPNISHNWPLDFAI